MTNWFNAVNQANTGEEHPCVSLLENPSLENLLDWIGELGDDIVPGVLFAKVDGQWYGSIHRFNGPDPMEDRYIWKSTKAATQDDCVRKLIDLIIADEVFGCG